MTTFRIILAIAMLLVLAYGLYETAQWRRTGPAGPSKKQRGIRIAGFVFLELALGLWIGGMSLPSPTPKPITRRQQEAALMYMAYWTVTVLMVVPLIPLALLDYRETIHRAIAERKELSAQRAVFVESLLSSSHHNAAGSGDGSTGDTS